MEYFEVSGCVAHVLICFFFFLPPTVHMNPEVDPSSWDHTDVDRYGLGGVRTPEQFYNFFGIDVVKKKTQGHLCEFVDEAAKMHKQWTPLLRGDGMGIDYSSVNFHWVDPNPEQDSRSY